ncbi:MAG: hypothetical protein LBU61_00525 [Coriobacteriales bacterium]|jgi:hypothetical protein|nr:hypothetical protein [Coriobacteriales bacterium]
MDIVISHKSALEYWRGWRAHDIALDKQRIRQRVRKAPEKLQPPSFNQKEILSSLSLPIDVLVASEGARRPSQWFYPHIFRGTVPDNGFVSVEDEIFVCSPELVFLQLGNVLSLLELIETGYELCGRFAIVSSEEKQDDVASDRPEPDATAQSKLIECQQLTSVAKLKAFIERMPGQKGRSRCLRALRYIADDSASPMEIKLAMLLCLPYKLGGYGLPLPELNYHVYPGKAVRGSLDRSFYSCDLYWPEHKLAVEYDSDQFHSATEHIASDSRKRTALAMLGVDVVTVTRTQVRSFVQLENVAKVLAAKMGRQLRMKIPKFSQTRHKLRSQLL